MSRSHFHTCLTLGILLSSTVVGVGCQSVRGAHLGAASQPVAVPPLPVSTGPVVLTGGQQFQTAPVQLAEARSQSPSPAPQPALSPPRQLTQQSPAVPASSSSANAQKTAGCLPTEAEWRAQMEEQTTALMQRLSQVEKELLTTKSSLRMVNMSLQASEQKIDKLNQDVSYWKNEVQRLEDDLKTQQQADLKSLDELTSAMHQVLLKQHPPSSRQAEAVK